MITLIVIAAIITAIIIVGKRQNKKQAEKNILATKKLEEQIAERLNQYHLSIGYNEDMLAENNWKCEIAGIHIDNRETLSGRCKNNEELILVREPKNMYDKNAIRIDNQNSETLGYVQANYAKSLAPLMDKGDTLRCFFDYDKYSGTKYYAHITIVHFK